MKKELLELEMQYIEMFKDEISPFPPYWFDYGKEEEKIKILKEAINKKELIVDINFNFVEGVF